MNIEILQLIEGAKRASGLAVIIDVFRAFSTDCYVFANGVKMIIPVEDKKRGFELKEDNPQYILMGEREGKKLDGFRYGNSPTKVKRVDFSGRTVIQTTSAGTRGLLNARGADEIVTGSFVNAGAVVKYIIAKGPEKVSLVCMGEGGREVSDEDTLCAEYIKSLLEDKPIIFSNVRDYLKDYKSAEKFFDKEKKWAPREDFDLCMDLDRFSFVLTAIPFDNELLSLRKVEIPTFEK